MQYTKTQIRIMKYQILSPDGFPLERDVKGYTSKKKAIEVFNNWKKRYETQGYYSSVNHGKIHLDDLIDFCEFIQVK